MRVRVYDKAKNRYYKSEVHAIVDDGWYGRYLVLEPCGEESYLKLVDYSDKSQDGKTHSLNVNVITPEGQEDWVSIRNTELAQLRTFLGLSQDILRSSYYGFRWLTEDKNLLVSLIEGQAVEINEAGHGDKVFSSILEGWNYIERQEDLVKLLDTTGGFHDSCLKCLDYTSGAKVLDNNSMMPVDNVRRVTMIYDSQWCRPIEMVFEGVIALNLRPGGDNLASNLYGASVILEDETVYFCDEYEVKDPASYEGTWIKAYNLRWRLMP